MLHFLHDVNHRQDLRGRDPPLNTDREQEFFVPEQRQHIFLPWGCPHARAELFGDGCCRMKDGIGMFLVQRMQKEVAASDDCLQVFPCLSCSLPKLITSVSPPSPPEGKGGDQESKGSGSGSKSCNLIRYVHIEHECDYGHQVDLLRMRGLPKAVLLFGI